MLAICIRCGEQKRMPWQRCSNCGFDPAKSEDSLVKSVYLSTGRFNEQSKKEQYIEDLLKCSRDIKDGGSIEYDPRELFRLRAQKEALNGIPISEAWRSVARLFLPVLLLVPILLIIFLLRRIFLP